MTWYTCNESTYWTPMAGGKYRAVAPNGKLVCLDNKDGAKKEVQTWKCSGMGTWAPQRWTFTDA